VKSILPARGRTVALTALAAVLLLTADAHAQTGGFSSDPPAVEPQVATAAMNADRRTALAPAGAPDEVVKAVAAANRLTRKPY
jgi:hypothetical protein